MRLPNKTALPERRSCALVAAEHSWRGAGEPSRSAVVTSKLTSFTFALALSLFGVSGCAHMEKESQRTLSALRSAVPAMRSFAIEHVADLSERDRLLITNTEPKILHANYSIFYYSWPEVCEVESFRPPSPPNRVIDRRHHK